MKLWKRNAVVAAIVLFVCVAVYLNWSYDQGQSVSGMGSATTNVTTDRNLGEAALVNSDGALGLRTGSASGSAATDQKSDSKTTQKDAKAKTTFRRLLRHRPHQPGGGTGQLPVHPAKDGERPQGQQRRGGRRFQEHHRHGLGYLAGVQD